MCEALIWNILAQDFVVILMKKKKSQIGESVTICTSSKQVLALNCYSILLSLLNFVTLSIAKKYVFFLN